MYTTVEKSLIAFAPYIPRCASESNLGALAIIVNFSTLVYNILFRIKYVLNSLGRKEVVLVYFFDVLRHCVRLLVKQC
jgi:hypothetical protein